MSHQLWYMGVAALCALILMPLAIRVGSRSQQRPDSPQHVHALPTSRLGGSALLAAYAIGILLAAGEALVPYHPLLLLPACALPVFLAGIREDVTGRLSPTYRLAGAALSAVLASVFAAGVIARLDIPYVDDWLDFQFFAILLTCFMVMGACNAVNLIDGFNGLAGGTALLMFAGIAAAAAQLGDALVFVQAVAMIGALAGFLYWNYPRARVFMGDGGAYFVGFVYAELSIQIVARNGPISAWFVIMLAAYPIVETLYSMYRRLIVLQTPSTEPDALHLHSLLYHRITLPAERGRQDASTVRANARVAPRLWLHGLLCLALALVFRDNTMGLLIGIVAYVVVYILHYRAVAKVAAPPEDDASLELRKCD